MINYKVYQINHDRDHRRLRYESYARMIERAGALDSYLYDHVLTGTVRHADGSITMMLEDIYVYLNPPPVGLKMRSLSVSDIVVLFAPDMPEEAYYCDTYGFRYVPEFAPGGSK